MLKTKKKILKKKEAKPIGKVTHYFSEIRVAVIKLSAPIKLGSEIRITGGESTDFSQKVESMEVDHKKVKTARKGACIGLKLKKKAREGYKVFKA